MKTQEQLLKELDTYIKEDDNEGIHGVYDQLIILRLNQHEPSFIKMLDKKVKGITFWYA